MVMSLTLLLLILALVICVLALLGKAPIGVAVLLVVLERLVAVGAGR